jgi:NAD(P)H-dependent flavin oxidoreductase YrpB (nitropropane dioxygenase family)
MDLLDRLSLEVPVVQAGMGGGIAGAELAAAVSCAGGLGTVGISGPKAFAAELRRARELAGGRPVSANLLLPYTRRAHVRACIEAGVGSVSLFFGFDRRVVDELRAAGIAVLHQVGTVDGARRAVADGADALVAQGLEAGGHLLATEPLRDFLPEALAAAGGRPVLAAGGIHDGPTARAALDAGAAAVWCGSRFLLTEESRAHQAYKARALGAPGTVETKLFGLSWPERHRVLPNAATQRWGPGGAVGRAAAMATAATAPLARVLPLGAAGPLASVQRLGVPLYGPAPPLAGQPERLLDVTPLYAGACVRSITRIVPAAEAVRALAVTAS